jgi:2'-5' RNA ligase
LPDLPDKIRAFVALRMSAEVESAITELVARLLVLRSSIRWVRLANLHLTMRFLGDAVDRSMLRGLDQLLNEVAAQTAPFMLNARGTGAFPNLDRPRTIWVGVESEELIQLAQRVEGATAEAGFTPEERPYSPHLTIGRVRDLQGWQRIRQVLSQSAIKDFGSTLIAEMILYRSILGGQASRYEPLARYCFGER